MTTTCDVCQGSKRIRVPSYRALSDDGDVGVGFKEFDCPQCVPTVPYRRVRAVKIATSYEAETFGKFQMPIERALAARFGEYLLREGLIRFSTTGSRDMGQMDSRIGIVAHLGVVSREDVTLAGADAEVALISPPPVPRKLTDRERARLRVPGNAVRWEPKPAPWAKDEPTTDEFDEPKDAIAGRFSGLEIL